MMTHVATSATIGEMPRRRGRWEGRRERMTQEDLLTVKQAAVLLGLKDESWVRDLIRTGRLPAIKMGRDYVLRRKDVEEFRATPRHRGRPRKGEGPLRTD